MLKKLRYILLFLIIGLYACEVPKTDTSHILEEKNCVSSVINDISDDYANRLQQQYDCTNALTSYQIGTRSKDNRLRTRRHERISTSWQLRTSTQQLYAALRYLANSISHNIKRIVAQSCMLPLSLPTEQISFPFHSFW